MDDFPDHLELAVGEERTVTLPGLGTAGFMWQDRVTGPAGVVDVAWSRGFAPGTEPTLIGVSAPEAATIRAVGPGEVTLDLVQVRPWQPDAAPQGQRRITVRVR